MVGPAAADDALSHVSDTAAIATTAMPARAGALVSRFMGSRVGLENPPAPAEILNNAPTNNACASRVIAA
jgi:hypothetical protein